MKKKRVVKALLINPEKETITEIELEYGDKMLQELYRVIGCDSVEAMRSSLLMDGRLKSDDVWIDDEGLLKEQKHFWSLPYYSQWIAGNGVIMDTDEDGECVGHTFTPTEIIKLEKQIFWRHAK